MSYFVSDPETIKWLLKYNHFLWELDLCYKEQGFPFGDFLEFEVFKIADKLIEQKIQGVGK